MSDIEIYPATKIYPIKRPIADSVIAQSKLRYGPKTHNQHYINVSERIESIPTREEDCLVKNIPQEPVRKKNYRLDGIKYNARRKRRLLQNGGSHTVEQWEALKASYNYCCANCKRNNVPLTKDHIVEVCEGGTDDIENIQPLCKKCNFAKEVQRQIDKKKARLQKDI